MCIRDRSPILLLDEATSALDVATERRVLKNIMADTYPRTCIVTTHRPTVLNICTRVYAIRDTKCEVLGEEEIAKMVKDLDVYKRQYLNSVHQKKILDGWKKETRMWQEKQVSAYE